MPIKYIIEYTREFLRDAKRCRKRGLDMSLLEQTITILAETGTLPVRYRPHKLSGKYAGYWECHVQPDWLLVWRQDNNLLTLMFTNTGTHSDIFK